MGKKKKKQRQKRSPPRPDDMERIMEFLIRQGEKSVAAEILNFLSENEGSRYRSRDLANALGYGSDEDIPGFWYVLHRLHEAGSVDKDNERNYFAPSANAEPSEIIERRVQSAAHPKRDAIAHLRAERQKPKFELGKSYVGKLRVNPNGFGLVEVEDYEDEIFVPAEHVKRALDGDVVKVLVTNSPYDPTKPRNTWSKRFEGKITEVVERVRTELVGTLKRGARAFRFIPDESCILPDIAIKPKDAGKAQDGDKVVIHKLKFESDTSVSAKVKEVLGKAGDSKAEVAAIARSYGIDSTFPKAVVDEANQFTDDIPEDELAKRLDLRDKVVFTIDPFDAKDFDDALSIERAENGDFIVGVHIADVSHFVREGTKLDQEAQRRSTSVYLVDRVIPMLPSNLSENICSLNPNVDRLAYSVIFRLNELAEVQDYQIVKTVIHSRRRFTYEDVQRIIETGEGDYCEEILALDRLAKRLTRERMHNGAIDFETEEVKFKLDPSGKPVEVIKKVRLDSHRLIEEFMLLANKTVAKHIATHYQTEELGYPAVYRVHDSPLPEKIKTLAEFVRKLGFKLELKKNALNNDTASSHALKKLLQDVKGTSVETLVSEVALRSMAKAVYSDRNIGHYGLAFDCYTHFTSPIRRYPDLITHRLLYEYETLRQQGKRLRQTRLKKLRETIPAICEHASAQERLATDAERDSIKLKQVEYISEHIGNVYSGVISGVTEFGVYVRIDDIGVEGLVHIKNLQDDFYEFDERIYALVGKRSHRRLQLGKRVKIKVHGVDTRRRTIDFLLVQG
ncbi:MAG: ribonuclease R [Chloroherpetonaceae bacterium]|nr:ribonuclease R [Chloroherpetonaceae bacterium]MDW8438057.1 ribonuclease R [Chloroherpetonaceae bacterium]